MWIGAKLNGAAWAKVTILAAMVLLRAAFAYNGRGGQTSSSQSLVAGVC